MKPRLFTIIFFKMGNVVCCGAVLISLVVLSFTSQLITSWYCFEDADLLCRVSRWAPSIWAPVMIGVIIFLIFLKFQRRGNVSDLETALRTSSGTLVYKYIRPILEVWKSGSRIQISFVWWLLFFVKKSLLIWWISYHAGGLNRKVHLEVMKLSSYDWIFYTKTVKRFLTLSRVNAYYHVFNKLWNWHYKSLFMNIQLCI